MFGGESGNPVFPVFFKENQFQYDSNASAQLQLFGNFPASCTVDPVNCIGNNHVSALNRPTKRGKERQDILGQLILQISLNNVYQDDADLSAKIPNTNPVSTGLRLSYDDDEHNSSVTSASGSMTTLPVISSLDDSVRTEIDRQKEEFDHYIRLQEEQISKGLREMQERHMASFLCAIENSVDRKLREKELDIGNMNRKNRELVERIKQAALEAQSWQYRVRCSESVVNVLKNNLKQAIAEGAYQGKEGCGDSEVDDTASSFDHNIIPSIPGKSFLAKGLKEQMICWSCKCMGVSILLFPCRHLCLCKNCEGFVEVCPICQSMKTASVQVYMS